MAKTPGGPVMADGSAMQERADSGAVAGTRRRPGRFGVIAGAVALGLAATLGASIWRLRSAEAIPDVGDPFDVAAARRPIELPDADNAYVLYDQAHRQFTRRPAPMARVELADLTWAKAGQAVRDYLEQNRAALELWRRGSERPDALYHQPGELAMDTLLPLVQDIGTLAQLGGLEGSRLEEQGAMEPAWHWYRAMLRYSRLVGRHGVLIERYIGAWRHKEAARRIVRWAADPRADARMLRRALQDALQADALTPPLSDALKLGYLMDLRELRELRVMTKDIPLPGGKAGLLEQLASRAGVKVPLQRIWLRGSNDVERSRRAARILFANWLAQVDRPATRRAPMAIRSPFGIYAPDPTAPAAARALPPEELARVVDRNTLARHLFVPDVKGWPWTTPWEGDGPLALERKQRSALIVRLVAELYRRDHGRLPETAGALVGPDLEELPEGIAAGDPIPKSLD